MRNWCAGFLSLSGVGLAQTLPVSTDHAGLLQAIAAVLASLTGFVIATTTLLKWLADRKQNSIRGVGTIKGAKRPANQGGSVVPALVLAGLLSLAGLIPGCAATPAARVAALSEVYAGAVNACTILRHQEYIDDAEYVQIDAARRIASVAIASAQRKVESGGTPTESQLSAAQRAVTYFAELVAAADPEALKP